MAGDGNQKAGGGSEREKRLAEALRKNLARRKAQGRARREEAPRTREAAAGPATGETKD